MLAVVGQRIREIRKSKNLSQNDIAKRAGIAISQVGRIERGALNPSISALFVISRAMKVELKDLFKFEESFFKNAIKKEIAIAVKRKAKAIIID
ncbi:MAG: helix-turn-helix transcriptional regulator [Bacteroidetes bacterium]|nr:helix-turn-helix transcriptional regulator [Bacteroidota bacterium]